MNALFNGLMISGGIIVTIGAQNTFVLKQGLLKQNIGTVVLVCWLCDLILMSAGVLGVATLLSSNPTATAALSAAGGLFLLAYGFSNLKRAWKGGGHMSVNTNEHTPKPTTAKAVATALALTLLNPHVYIDTLMLIGGSAVSLSSADKIWFLTGAVAASAIWFVAIGYGTRLLLPLFRRERVWQILDSLIALMMFYLAYSLLKQVPVLLT